ncbi:ABC transporter permease subunit [Nakamurella sp. YIM 132087]|uniref:ABC transporter permease subunit n=1 Tax=Nakamurella alba TaxID=2665158 RepID=A0A7K1FV05_9ACTN|nr:carbohydrate ABC transporter permease [Nakamurella alba]MTD17189.1 ABC transporter permease subunit [Nakamurella alba]
MTVAFSSRRSTAEPKVKAPRRPAWQPAPHPAITVLKVLALVVVVALVLLPCLVVVSTSLAGQQEVIANGGWVIWPTDPTFDAYREVLTGGVVTRATLISAGVTIVGTTLSLLCTIGMAYALSRPNTFAGKPITLLVLFTLLFTPGMIPTYLVVTGMGLKDTYASLIVPVLVNAFNLVVLRGFFQRIPNELIEAAKIEGAGEVRILTRIVLPLSKAAVAVVGLFYAVQYWNSFFGAVLYLDDSAKWPIQLVLRQYVIQGSPIAGSLANAEAMVSAPNSIQMAVVVLAMLPIICVYPFLQRHFMSGVLTGAVKS